MSESKSWSTATRYFVLILVLGAFLWLAISARDLIGPLAISALLAYLLDPLVSNVSRQIKLSRSLSVLLVFALMLIALVIAVILIAPLVPHQVTSFAAQLEEITIKVEEALSTPVTILNFEVPLDSFLATWPEFSQDVARPDLIIDLLQSTSENLIWILVVLVTTYYLLLDWVNLRDWLFRMIPESYRPDARRLYQEIRNVWKRYFHGQLRLMFFIGFLTGIAAAAVGLPGSFAFGVLAGIFNIVLSIGPLIVMITAALVALFTGSTYLPISNFWFMILVIIIFNAISVLENVWLRPKIMSERLHLHPAVVFIAVVASLTQAGVLTALIIVPLISSIMVVARYTYCKFFDLPVWPEDSTA